MGGRLLEYCESKSPHSRFSPVHSLFQPRGDEGGSPDGARLVVRAFTPWEQYAAEAKRIAGITAELAEPAPVKK